jgi:hypothetical protein
MIKDLKRIATRRFSGDTRIGPRYEVIIDELRKRGCAIAIDRYGNLWVEHGSGRKTVLFSSHMDVDPRVRKMSFRSYRLGRKRMVAGMLDNSVGCYINIMLTSRPPEGIRVIHVFTASEEVERTNTRRFCRSAREVVKELRRRKIRPDLCVAIDVTFPAILDPGGKLDWRKDYYRLFDVDDPTHCYVEGFVRRKTAKLAERLVRRFHDPTVGLRRLSRYDEAFVYGRIAPSFAVGPVIHGHMDRPDQTMPLVHIITVLRFLRMLLESIRGPLPKRR